MKQNKPKRPAQDQQKPPQKGTQKKNQGNVPKNNLAPTEARSTSKIMLLLMCIALCLSTFAIYAQVAGNGFVAYDDDQYVYENAHLKSGLTLTGVKWAFTTFYYANWHPLTWLSHMLDYQLFGLNAGGHHVVNLLLHLCSVILLFLVFVKMTRKPWRSFMIAAIFAIHPLHVESVAWISERKDVLSTFFGLLTLLFYVRYVDAPSKGRYAWVVSALTLGLLSKPMLVTMPFVLLLIDLWPLRRIGWPLNVSKFGRLVAEKALFFLLIIPVSVFTFLAQQQYGAVASLVHLSLPARLGNASIAYVNYLGKAFLPLNLAVLYPIQTPPVQNAIGALLLVLAITCAAVYWAKHRPWFLVGWLWYLGMLVPVIGLIQVGAQSIADRYMYLPLVGISMAIVWEAAELTSRRHNLRNVAAGLAALVLLALGIMAYRQTELWKSSRTLFEHTVAVTKGNYIINNNLGVILAGEGKNSEAIAHYRQALAFNPDYSEAHANLGHELLGIGNYPESFTQLSLALKSKPDQPIAQGDLGTLLAAQGKFEESERHLEASLRIAPANPNLQGNLCYVLQRLGKFEDAISHCNEALRLSPDLIDARYNLATALMGEGKNDEAVAELKKVLASRPKYPGATEAMQKLGYPEK
jgi:protein O-mannosyl-transferase